MEDYSDVNWLFVNKVERVDELTMEIIRDRHTTIYEFDTPAECLENFIQVKKMWREKHGKKWEFKRKSSKRLSDIR
jgi:hypothetical protein